MSNYNKMTSKTLYRLREELEFLIEKNIDECDMTTSVTKFHRIDDILSSREFENDCMEGLF